jgi:hypothetical protein
LHVARRAFFLRNPNPHPFPVAYSVVSKKSGKTYYLHARLQKLRGGHEITLYYFAARLGEGTLEAVPAGYVVAENEKTGLPLLKKG